MLNFTIGPVQSNKAVRRIGGEQVPYFRTAEFSAIMRENEALFLELLHAPEDSRAVFLTGSGTAAMESTIMHVLSPKDRAIIVEGGSFGHRFCQLCDLHGIAYTPIRPDFGRDLDVTSLREFDVDPTYTTFIVNIHETSTGVHFDLDLIADFCRRNRLLLIIDAISSFLADPLDMTASGADVVLSGSQKALACPPGISLIALSPRALRRVETNPTKSFYLSIKPALKDGERGQTPFTPAVGVLLQINQRLRDIKAAGGVSSEIEAIKSQAQDFRDKLAQAALPFSITSESMSNSVTPIRPLTARASTIFDTLKDEYEIWICPSGGELKDTLLRVGHLGSLTPADNDTLIAALKHLEDRGII